MLHVHCLPKMLWASALFSLTMAAAVPVQADNDRAITTSVTPSTALDLSGTASSLRVQLSAHQHTRISSQLAGKVTTYDKRAGEHFKRGDTLVAFDCDVKQARLRHSIAAESAASKKLAVAQQLNQLNSISVSEVAQAQADRAMARAETGINRAMLKRCKILALYDGVVAERSVQPGEYVAEGTELLSIYDASTFDVELIVPSRWLSWLKAGQPFTVTLDETGQQYRAKVTRLGSVIDPLAQSFKVHGQIDTDTANLLPGMSGNAQLVAPKPVSVSPQANENASSDVGDRTSAAEEPAA